ncbi:uncharacterized protein KIAA1671 homolog isoform X2 [Tiliqua scincoides]|uniref:uncharacterized protein KIAA1671 homolog isoform X2 n=1 Tax=Tiliqua scincoides TaxID=71010 RepID=UPI003462B7FE
MAMQVEVGAALAALANLSELTNEAKLQRALASPLSDAGGQPGELPLSPLLLEERGSFGNPLRTATMTPATARPRLTPKPFCREKSAETFAIVKPPVPVLKPSTAAPKPSVFAQTLDTSVTRGLTGSVPPLVDQTLVESKASNNLVANIPFYSSPQANTVILFETGSADRVRMTLTPDRNIVGVPRTLSTLPAQEGKLPSSKSEVFCRRPDGAGIHRQLSLSSESRPGPWNPCRPLERADTLTDTSEEKAKEGQKQLSSHISPAGEGQLRLKQRPVSAIFLESLKDQKPCTLAVSDEKPLLEKPWVRKPRPLSVDLTAKFENRDLSVQRKSCPFEVKEKNLATHLADVGSGRPSEKSETAGLGRADLSKSNLKTAVRTADSPGAKSVADSQAPSANEAASSCPSAPKDLVSEKERKCLWEPRLKNQDEQTDREVDTVAAAGKSQERHSSAGRSVQERALLDRKEICSISENGAGTTGTKSRSSKGGDAKKLLNLLDASANGAAPVSTELRPPSPEKECRILNIQQRIKELTAENTEAKPGNLHRSFRSRPLSTDLTKLFSSPATGSRVRLERQAELNRKPLSETQEVPEEASPACGPDRGEERVLGPPWKPQQPVKTPHTYGHLEKDSGVVRERQNMALQGDLAPSLADPKPHSVATSENPHLKTVRATVFEHSVQRHNVAADRLGTEPVSQPTPELAGGHLGHGWEPWLEKALESQTSAKKVPPKQAGVSPNAVKYGQAAFLNEDPAVATWEKYTTKETLERPAQKHIEDSLKYQRIEPRYEILQTVGERVQSEAVAAVSEDKAVTLRSRRSLKERRRAEEGVAAGSWPRSLDLQECSWGEDGSVSKMKGPGEAAVKGCSVSHDLQVSHEQISGLNKSQARQQQAPARAPYFPSRNKDLGTADHTVSRGEKERPEVCFPDKMEGSKVLKRFPESFGAGPGRTDSCEARAHVGENTTLARAGEHESPSSPGGTSQWPRHSSSKASPPSVDLRTYKQEDSRVLGSRKTSSASCAKEEWGVSGRLVAGEGFGQLDVEEGIRRSTRGVSTPKATERWRRKTLPHGAIRFEDAGALAPESAKALGRRDSLQLHSSSVAKRSRESRCEADPREGSPASPSHPGDSMRQQLSPSELRATYFAAAAQEPGENENAFDSFQSRPVSSAVENLLLSPSTSRRSHRQHNKRLPVTPGSLDRHRSKSWGEGGTSDLPRPGDARCENWRPLGRHLGDAQERGAGVAPPIQSEPKSPSYLRHFPQDQGCLGLQNCGSCNRGVAKGKGTDGYRSRVLDIDALMAEYKDDSKREGGPSQESSLSLWEKLARRRNSADKTYGSCNSSSPKGLDRSPRSTGQGVRAAEFRWPEHVCSSEQEKMESCSRESSPLKARDVALITPGCRLAAEKPKYLPADPTSTRKKTFIVDEEHGESFVLRHQRAKCASGNAQLASPVHVDPEPGAGQAPRPSQGLPDGVSWKGTSPAQQAAGVARSEEDCHKTVHASGLNQRKGGADVGLPATDASRVEARAERHSSESGLANAPPDLRRSYSEKARQARVRGSLPSGPDVREGVHQSSLPERLNGWLGKRGTLEQDASFREGRRDLEKERPEQGHRGSGARSPPYLPARRRSRSFYKERRTDHWAPDQLKECFGRPAAEAKDTDTLVQEPDSQYGTWSDQRRSGDSFVPESPSSESNVASAQKQLPGSRLSSFSSQTDSASAADRHDSSRDRRSASLDRSGTDVDSADGTEGPAPADACPDFSFLDHTPVLDSSALKTRVQLSKRRRQHRAPISHSLRRSTGGDTAHRLSVTEEADSPWMFQDGTDARSAKRDGSEEEEEEEKMHPVERSPGSQPQRLPMFPGMDHSVLKAQLRKRQEMEGTGDGSPVPLSKSPKSPFQGRALGGRVLPTGVEKEERSEEPSPQWLRELKSKKRQSQYENQV